MADEKISEMTNATSVADADIAPVVQSGANKKAAMSVLKTYMATSPVMVGTKARFVAVTGPPGGITLQVKNDSGVWEDIWTVLAST